jgi:hypothetical protein
VACPEAIAVRPSTKSNEHNAPLEDPELYVVYVRRTYYLPLKIRTFVDSFTQEFVSAPPAKLTVAP